MVLHTTDRHLDWCDRNDFLNDISFRRIISHYSLRERPCSIEWFDEFPLCQNKSVTWHKRAMKIRIHA